MSHVIQSFYDPKQMYYMSGVTFHGITKWMYYCVVVMLHITIELHVRCHVSTQSEYYMSCIRVPLKNWVGMSARTGDPVKTVVPNYPWQ